ncbi:ATP-dependent Clp protease proteolytic subunit 5 [Cymbomonas tetramitiformis]|uniref:ATP-dependent Clp protease proteolytic subunit n=1 Tax=Cymbomonas tetramitiformis TaxID=36881 RepID=A0AAE0BYJ9_9CHLO|nr:ATP-dependent Clp protease proteolytic subunit 5 [Cymbomonas tetramitiformis]
MPARAAASRSLNFSLARSKVQGRTTRLNVSARGPRGPPTMVPNVQVDGQMMDVMGYLKSNRIIFIGEPITDKVVQSVITDMLALELADPNADIKLYLNSPEGTIHSIIALVDMMKLVKCDVSTVAFGMCGGLSAVILASGTKGKRYSMPNTRILLHQPMGGAQGSAYEVNIQAKELARGFKMVCTWYSDITGMSPDELMEELDRDNFMSPTKAVELGFIDGVIE